MALGGFTPTPGQVGAVGIGAAAAGPTMLQYLNQITPNRSVLANMRKGSRASRFGNPYVGLSARMAQRDAALRASGLTAALERTARPALPPAFGTGGGMPMGTGSAFPGAPTAVSPPHVNFPPPGPGAGPGSMPVGAGSPGGALVPPAGPNWQSTLGQQPWGGSSTAPRPTPGAGGAAAAAAPRAPLALPAAGQTGRPGPVRGAGGPAAARPNLWGRAAGGPAGGLPAAPPVPGGLSGWWGQPMLRSGRMPMLTRGLGVGIGAGIIGNTAASAIANSDWEYANEVAPIVQMAGTGVGLGSMLGPWGALGGGLLGAGIGALQGFGGEDPLDEEGALGRITELATTAGLSPENQSRLSQDFALYTAAGMPPEAALQASIQTIMAMRDSDAATAERRDNALAQQAIIASFMQPALEDAQHLNRTNVGRGYGSAIVGQTHAIPVLNELAAMQARQQQGVGTDSGGSDLDALLATLE